MCIIAIKTKKVGYPSFKRVKTMCESNPDGFALVWQAKDEPVHNYRTLNQGKFLKKYKWLTSTYKAKDVAFFLHARIKTHGSEKLENCHGWIEDSIGLAFAHNGILSISNRGDMTDSETFFRDIFTPIFKIGGWVAGELAIKAVIGTSKFCFMDMHGNLIHYGKYITGDDGILYSNDSYEERTWKQFYYQDYGYGGKYSRYFDKYSGGYSKTSTQKTTSVEEKTVADFDYDDYDDWYNSEEYWKDKVVF